jgi:predicted enzyme related to lactoylglutathione lyase
MRRTLTAAAICACVAACTVRDVVPAGGNVETIKMSNEFYGLRTARYTAHDLDAAKKWYIDVLGEVPYFDQPFYVGFNVGGFELGITPDTVPPAQSATVYWGVGDAAKSYARLLAMGAKDFEPVQDVGGGVRIGAVRDPFGNIFGIVENPEFRYTPPAIEGPGR